MNVRFFGRHGEYLLTQKKFKDEEELLWCLQEVREGIPLIGIIQEDVNFMWMCKVGAHWADHISTHEGCEDCKLLQVEKYQHKADCKSQLSDCANYGACIK